MRGNIVKRRSFAGRDELRNVTRLWHAPPVPTPALPRWPAAWPHAWLAPGLVAAAWSIVLGGASGLAVQRNLVFIGGPLVLLAGLHARLGEFLHGRARERLALLPVAPGRHFAAGLYAHVRGFAAAFGFGALGIAVATLGDPWRTGLLLGDFAWLCAIAWLVEPTIPAIAAWAGRRFPDEHPVRQAQRQLGGGWTTPEATVHLYAPALGLALAIALAMPGQLALALVADGRAWTGGLAAPLIGPAVVACGLRLAAARIYGVGFFAAVSWLSEAIRSLAGPPEPPARPGWVARVESPALRLWLTQWLRLTALPLLRAGLVIAWAAYCGLRGPGPTGPTIALGLGLCALWLMPLQTMARQRRRNAAILRPLPISAQPRVAIGVLFAVPPLLWAAAVGGRALVG